MTELHRTIFVLAFLTVGASAGPLIGARSQCSRTCTDTTKFNYIQGTTYTYQYQGDVITKVNGASNEHSGMHISATAKIEVLDKCDFGLQLSNVHLKETDPQDENKWYDAPNSQAFKRALEQRSLHFSFQDGRIEDVCVNDEDPTWVANIKKAVLSSFQNSMEDLQIDTKVSESDITGTCDTEYKVAKKGWTSFTVTKSKDLQSCTDRNGYRTALQSTHYRVPAKIQSLPITKGSHHCTQTYHSSGRLTKSECVESHIFRPFSKESNGATTNARHSLTFVTESTGLSMTTSSGSKRSTLRFEHENQHADKGTDIEPSLSTIREFCRQTSQSVRPETPALFARLVYQIKEMNDRTLKDLHNRVSNNRVCEDNHENAKKFLHDAIPMVGTSASVKMIAELVKSRHVQDSEAEAWLSSLAFVKNPTREMITYASVLLQREPTKTVYLPVSAMVNTYCKTHDDCETDNIIQGVVQIIQGKLNYNCQYRNPRERESIMIALKSLGNMGHGSRVTETLNRCMLEPMNPIDIRLAAVDAYRRQSCNTDRSRVMDTFKDTNEDVEVRIAAYLAVMQCATLDTLTAVQHTLEREPVNQVGSFVWTHLTNIRETSDLHKQTIRRILEDQTLRKQFNLDKTKFSRNFEGSFFSDSLNAGAKVESNVVFSPKSYLPRSAMLNLTFDLFGESVNLLEVGGRVEGVERLVENYFGPKGYFGSNNLKDAARTRRSMPNDINTLHNKFAEKTDDKVRGTAYFKIFGHEISFVDLMNMQEEAKQMNILEVLIMLAREHDINYNKNFMFLDTSMTIPTITGLPIKLAVNGTATVSLKMKGKLDLRKLGSSPRSLDINGHFKPSAAVELSTMMGVDAHVTHTGIKMVSTLHTSSEVEGKVMIKDSQIVQLKLNAPKDKIEIFNAETKFYTLHRQTEREQKILSAHPVVKARCSGAGLSKVLGVEICGHVEYPGQSLTNEVPFYPLTGPSKMNIFLKKTDAHTSYQFEAKMLTQKTRRNHQTNYNHVARLAFDTPGSSVNRKIDFDFELNRGDKKIHFNMITPWKTAGLRGEIINLENEKRASLKFTIDDEHVYSAKTGITIQHSTGFSKYSPSVEIRIPGWRTITVQGGMEHQQGRKMDIDLSMNNLLAEPVIFRGTIQKESRRNRDRYNTDLQLQSSVLNAKVGGYIEKKNDGLRSRLALDYGKGTKPEHRMVLNYKMRNHETPSLHRVVMDTALQTTQFPDYSFATRVEVQKAAGHAEATVSATYGSDPNDKLKKIDATGIFKYKNEDGQFNLDSTMKFKYPMMKYDWDVKLFHSHESSVVKTTAKLNSRRQEILNFDLSLLDQSTDLKKYTADISLRTPSRDMRFYQLLDERQQQEYHHDVIVQWARNKILSTRSMYKKDDEQHAFNVDIRVPNYLPINVNGQLNTNLRDFSATGSVSYDGKDYSANVFYRLDAEHHITGGKILIPYRQPIAVSLDVKPTLNDMSVSASAEYGADVYRLRAAYNTMWESSHQMIRGNVDVRYPGRRVTGTVAAKRTNSELSTKVEAKWDADRDASKAVVFDAEYKYPSYTQHNGHLQMKIPGKQVTGKFSLQKQGSQFKTNAELQWDRRSKMTFDTHFSNSQGWGSFDVRGGVLFTSPFAIAKRVGGSFSHETRGHQYTTHAELVFAENKKLSTDLFFNTERSDNFEGRLTIKTPLAALRIVNLQLKHIFQSQHMTTIVSGTIQDHTVHGELTLKTKDAIEGAAKLKLPIRYLEDLGISFFHHAATNQWTNRGEIVWSPTGRISLDTLLRPESWTKANGHIRLTTPFAGARTFNLKLNHLVNNNVLSSKANGELEGKTVEYEIVVKNSGDSYKRDLEGTLRFKTPIHRFENVGVSLKYSDDGSVFSGSAEARWDPRSQVSTSFMMNHFRRGYHISNEGTFSLKTPFTQVQHLQTTWKSETSDKELVLSKDIVFNGARYHASLDAKHENSQNERQLGLNLALESPYTRPIKSNMKATIRHSYAEVTTWVSIDNQRKIDMESSVGFNRWNVNANIKADMSRLLDVQPMSASLKTILNDAPYSVHVEGSWAPEKEVTIDGSIDLSQTDKIDGSLHIASPLFEKIGFSLSHEKRSEEYSTRVSLQWKPTKTISLVSNVKAQYGRYGGNVNLNTPFDILRSVSMKLDHAGRGLVFRNNHAIDVVSGNTRLSSECDVVFRGLRDMSYKIQLKSAAFNVDIISALRHQYTNSRMVSSWDLTTTNGKRYGASLDLDFDNTKATLEVNTPLDVFKHTKVTVTHTGSFPYTRCSLKSETTTKAGKTTVDAAFNLNGKEAHTASLQIRCPCPYIGDVAFTSSHRVNGDVYKYQADLTHAGKKYDLDGTLNLGDAYSLELKTPWNVLKNVKASLATRGVYPYITGNVEIMTQTTSGRIGASGNFAMNGRRLISGEMEVHSPSNSVPVKIIFSHAKENNMWTTILSSQSESGKYAYKSRFQFTDGIVIDIDVKTPSPFLNALIFQLNHKGSPSNFDHKLFFEYNVYVARVRLDNSWTVRGLEAINGHIKLTSPIRDWEHVAFIVNHGKMDGEWTTTADFDYTPGRRIQLRTDLKLGHQKKFDISLTTPYSVMRRAIASVSHEGGITSFENKIALNVDGKKLDSTVEFDMNRKMKAAVRVGKYGNTWSAEVSQSMSNSVVEVESALKHNEELVADLAVNVDTRADSKVTVKSNYNGKSLDLSIDHSGRGLQFKNNMKVKVNNVNAEYELNVNKFSFITFNVEITNLFNRPIVASLSHRLSRHQWNLKGEYNRDSADRITFAAMVNTRNNIIVELGLTTPSREAESLKIKMDNGRNGQDIRHSMTVNYNGLKNVMLSTNLHLRGFVFADASMKTTGLGKDLSVSLYHNIIGTEKTSTFNILIDGSDYFKIASKLQMTRGVKYTLTTDGPCRYVKDARAEIEFNGDLSSFYGKLGLSHGMLSKPYQVTMTMNRIGSTGTSATFAVEKDGSNYIKFNGQFKMSNGIHFTGAFNGPCKYLKDASVQFDLNGDLASFDTKLVMRHGMMRNPIEATLVHNSASKSTRFSVLKDGSSYISFSSQLQTARGIRYIASFDGPCKYTKDVGFELNFNGDMAAFDTKLIVKHGMMRNPIQASLVHDSRSKSIRFDVMKDESKYISFSSQLQMSNGIQYTASLNGPCKYFKDVNVEFGFNGDLSAFDSKLVMRHGMMRNPIGATLVHNSASKLTRFSVLKDGSSYISFFSQLQTARGIRYIASFDGPCKYTKDVGLEFNFNGDMASFDTKLIVKHGMMRNPIQASLVHRLNTQSKYTKFDVVKDGSSYISFFSQLQMSSGIRYNLALDGPCRLVKGVSVQFDFSGDKSAFNSKLVINHKLLQKPFQAEVDFKLPIDIKVRVNPSCEYANVLEVTLKNEVHGNRRYSTLVTMRKDEKMVRLQSEMTLTHLNNFNGEITVTSPFNGMRKVSLNFHHEMFGMNLLSRASFVADNKQFDVNANLKSNEGSVIVKSPYEGFEEFGLKYNHEGNVDNMMSEISVYKNGKKIALKSEFKRYPQLVSQMYLTTPFKNWEKTGITVDYNNQAIKTKVDVQAVAYGKTFVINYSHDLEDMKEVQVTVKTPFADHENMFVYFKHTGNSQRFDTRLNLQYKSEKRIEATVGFYNVDNSNIRFDFEMKTPCSWIRSTKLSYNHQANRRDSSIKCNMVAENNGKSLVGVLDASRSTDQFAFTYRLKTPFRGYEDLKIMVDNRGDIRSFDLQSSLQYMTEKTIEMTLSHKARDARKVHTVLNMKTPCQYARDLTLSYKHDIQENSITINVEKSLMSKKITADFSAELKPTFKTSLKITTPFRDYENMATTVVFNGDLNRFSSDVRVEYDGGNIDTGITFMNMNMKQVELTVAIKTPFRNAEMTTLSYKHKGDASGFKADAELLANGKKVNGNVEFNMEPFEGKVTIETPFASYENIGMTLRHTKIDSVRCTSDVHIQYQTGKHINGKLVSKKNGLNDFEFTASMKTPFSQGMTVTLKNQADKEGLHATMKTVYGSKVVDSELVVMKTPLTFEFTVKTPFNGFENMYVRASHYPARRMTSAAVQYMTGKSITVTSVFAHSNGFRQVEGDVTIRHPFSTSSSEIKATYTHSLRNGKLETTSTLNYGYSKTISVQADYETTNGVDSSIVVATPFAGFEKMAVSLKHNGDMEQFTTNANVEYMTGKKIEAVAKFTSGRSYSGSLDVKTPFYGYESMMASFDHTGRPTNFRTNVLIKYRLGRQIEAKLNFQPSASELEIKTPFQNYEKLSVQHTHQGEMDNFRTTVTLQCMYKSASVDLSFTPKKAELNLRTPFTKYESNTVKYEFTGEAKDFSLKTLADIGNAKHEVALDFTPRNIKLNIKAPVGILGVTDTTIIAKSSGTVENYNAEISITEKRNMIAQLTTQFSLKPMTGRIALLTTFPPMRSVAVSFTHVGKLSDFKTTGRIETSRFGNGDFELTFTPAEADLQIRTPFYGFENMQMKYKVEGQLDNFRASSMVKYMTGSSINADVSFSKAQGLIRLRTPFAGFERTSMSYRFTGTANKFRLSSNIDLMTGKRIVATVEFQPEQSKITLRTPFTGFESLSAYYKYEDAKVNGYVSYMTGQRIAGEVQFKPTESKITLQTPFTGFESLAAYYKYEDMRLNGYVQYMTGKRISFSGNGLMSPLSMSLTVRTPFTRYETLSLSVSQQGTYDNMNSRFSLQYMTGKKIEGQFQMLITASRFEATTSLFTPCRFARDTTVTVKYDASSPDTKAELIVKYGNNKQIKSELSFNTENGINVALITSTPFVGFEEVYAKHEFQGRSLADFTTETKIQYATGKLMTSRLTVSAKNARHVNVDFQVESPCKVLPKAVVSYRHSISNNRINVVLNLHSIKAIVKGSMGAKSEIHFDVKTPFDSMKQTGLYVRGNGELKNAKGMAKLYFNRQYLKVDASYNVRSLTDIAGYAQFESSLYHRPIVVKFNHNGDLKTFTTTAMIDQVKIEAEFKHDSATSGKVAATYKDRAVSVEFKHQGLWKHFNTEAAVKCNEHFVQGRIDFTKTRRNIAATGQLKTSFNKWEETTVTVHHTGGMSEFRMNGKLQMEGRRDTVLDVTYKHKEQGIIAFRSPIYRLENVAISFQKVEGGYTSKISWAPYKEISATVAGSWRYDSLIDMQYNAVMTIQTPFSCVERLIIDTAHSHTRHQANNRMKISVNGKTYFDSSLEGKAITTGLNGKVTLKAPVPMELTLKIVATNAEKTAQAIINWDTTTTDRNVELLVQYKDGSNYYRTKHDGIIKVSLPWRICAVTTTLESSKYKSTHKTEFIWDQARGKKVSYAMTFRDRSRSYQRQWDADLVLSSPVRTVKTVFTHNDNGRRFLSDVQLLWDANRNEDKKMGLKTLYENYGLSHKLEVTFNHPKMTKDITVRGELTLNRNNFIYSGKTEVEYSVDPSEKLTVSGKLNKISRGTANNYTMTVHVTHPRSLVDVELNSHVGEGDSRVSAGTEMKYLTARRVQKNIFLMGEIDKIKKTMNVHMHTPLKSLDLVGQLKQLATGYRFEMKHIVDGKNKLNSEFEVNTEKPSVDLRLKDADNLENMVHAYARVNNGRELKFEAYRMVDGMKTTDGLLAITRNTSRLFHSRAHWNKNVPQDFAEFAKEKLESGHAEAANILDQLKRGVQDEMRVRSYYMKTNMPDTSAAKEYFAAELASFAEDADVIANEFNQMYERNDFFLKDIAQVTSDAVEFVSNHIQLLSFKMRRQMEEIKRKYNVNLAVYSRKMDEVMADVRDYIVDLVLRFRPAWQKYAYAVIRQYLVASQKANHNYQQMMETAESYKDTVVNYLDDNFDFITYRVEPYFMKIQELRTKLRSHLSEEQQDRYIDMALEKLYNIVTGLRETSSSWVTVTAEKYSEIKEDVKAKISAKLEDVMGHELSQKVMNKIVSTYKQMEELADHFEISRRLKNWAQKSYENAVHVVKDQVHEISKQYVRLDRSGFTVYSPENGEVQGELYLPLAMNLKWEQLKNFNMDVVKDEANKLYKQYLPNFDNDYSVWDTYYKYKPSSDISNWIPPYKAQASILGNEHYTTFDGKSYDFAGSCSYLMARDFANSHFTVIANYEQGIRKSITILSNNKQIEIFHDGKVTIDGRQTELPFHHVNTTVTTTGDVITVNNALGLHVACDMNNEMCTIGISGWFHGKTAGLLGTYDHEQSNDLLTSSKKISDDLDIFARSWQIGSCSGYRNYAQEQTTTANKVCDDLFNDKNSHFRPCYKIVNPGPYHKMCAKDTSNIMGEYSINKKACSVAKLYQTKCEEQGVYLASPKSCKACKTGENRINDGESKRISPINSADIVFVVEEKKCNKAAAQRLPHLVAQIEKALASKGLKQNRFGLVGFGSEKAHDKPHRHTLMNQVMNDATKFHRAVDSLSFVDGEDSNIFRAVRDAAEYPFRAGASKIIIAMPCSSHSHDSSSVGMTSYLAKNDIKFHTLAGYDFNLKSRSPKSSFIFGADRQTAYTSKDVYQLQGDQALFNMMVLPKDKCVTLALERHGSVFNAKKLTEGRVNTQKFFLDVFARRIAANAQPSQCQNCKCTNGQTECTPCSDTQPIQVILPAVKVRHTRSTELQFQDA